MTYAAFRKKVANHVCHMFILYRYGETDQTKLPAMLQGNRKVTAVRSYGFDLAQGQAKDKTSALRIESAKLFDFDEETGILSVWQIGRRPLRPDEQKVWDTWRKKTDENPNLSWWAQKTHFLSFEGKDYSYMLDRYTFEKDGTMVLRDKSVRGDLALKYKVTF